MQNILVTGGSGFIGSNFISKLLTTSLAGRIINLDKLTYAGSPKNTSKFENDKRYKFRLGDICDFKLVQSILVDNEIDTIVHFAAESHVDRSIASPKEFVKTNIEGTQNLLDAAKYVWLDSGRGKRNYRFHHISTDEVYGSLTNDAPISKEDDAYKPNSPYAASKAAADHIVRAYYKTYSLPISISNCSNNFGRNQHLEKLIPTVISSCLSRKDIPVYGSGNNIRDWIHVVDHVDGVIAILNKGRIGETYNIGGVNEISNISLVTNICEIMDKLKPISSSYADLITYVDDRPGHDWRYALDVSKISHELGWQVTSNFNYKLNETIEWYIQDLS